MSGCSDCSDPLPSVQSDPVDPAEPTLVQFLRHHRPLPPMADPGLEERVMAQLPDWSHTSAPAPQRNLQVRRWWMVGAIASGLAVAMGGYTAVRLAQPQPTLAELEGFIETSWQESVSDTPNPEFGLYISAMPTLTDGVDQGRSR